MKVMSQNVKNKIPLIEASVSAVILVIAAIFITTAYVKADSLKGEAEKLSEAAIRCEDIAEKLKLSEPTDTAGSYQTPLGVFDISGQESEVYRTGFDKHWNKASGKTKYELLVTASAETGERATIIRYTVSVVGEDGETIAELPSYIVTGIGE